MNNNQIIIGAIKNLIDGTKKILIPNAIITLTINLNEASEHKDFYLIDYEKYAKQIIDNSKLTPERKEEIREKFKKSLPMPKTPIAEPIKAKIKFFCGSEFEGKSDKNMPVPIKIKSSSPTIVTDNITHFDNLQLNPPKYRKTIYCRACKNSIEDENLIYYSGYSYHNYCIKCMKCHIIADISTRKIKDDFVSITAGLFLCRKHYREYSNSQKVSHDIWNEYHKKNKENFVKELFNVPFKNEEINIDINDDSENEIITHDIIDESIPVKRPFDDFVPTMTIRFDKLPENIDYDELEKFIGPEFEIVSVTKGSALIKLAYLDVTNTIFIDENQKKSSFVQKCDELKVKFNGTIGKGIVGNVIGEPIYSLPDDKKIQDEYNKPWLNALQNIHEFDKYDLDYIKKEVSKGIKSNVGKKNWAFIFKHEKIYEDVEKQIMKDVSQNEIELIIVAQTIITNKNIDKYNKIVKKIKRNDQKQLFLYHGTALKNHQLIVNKHFLMPGEDHLKKKTDDGYFGKGIYATDNMFYASKYANGYNDLEFNEKAHVICCLSVYNTSKVKELHDLSLLGEKITSDIKHNFGIHHAFVGSSKQFTPIPEHEKDFNYITANEFVFPNKFQIIPIYSFTVMRKDHFILWKDENCDNNENQMFLKEISIKTQVNVYNTKSVEEALKVIETKKRNKFKLITNGGGYEETGRKLIERARKIINSDFVCFVFANDKRHLNWITKMTNVLFSTNFEDFKNFVDLKLNEDDVYRFAVDLKNKYNYNFKLDKSQMLHFPTVFKSNYDVKPKNTSQTSNKNVPVKSKSSSNEYNFFMVQVLDQAERYEDAACILKQIINKNPILSSDERNLFSSIYKSLANSRRSSIRLVNSFLEDDAVKSIKERVSALNKYKDKLIKELDQLCKEVVTLIDEKLLPCADDSESQIFYLKLKADNLRFSIEFFNDDKRIKNADYVKRTYEKALKNARENLSKGSPAYLGLLLNYSVFLYEIIDKKKEAIELADKTFNEAVDLIEDLGDDDYSEASLILQLIKDNISLWTLELED